MQQCVVHLQGVGAGVVDRARARGLVSGTTSDGASFVRGVCFRHPRLPDTFITSARLFDAFEESPTITLISPTSRQSPAHTLSLSGGLALLKSSPADAKAGPAGAAPGARGDLGPPGLGDRLCLVGGAYGLPELLGSVICGVVVSDPRGASRQPGGAFVVDLRAPPGSEGSPLFRDEAGTEPCAVLVGPLGVRGKSFPLSVAVPMPRDDSEGEGDKRGTVPADPAAPIESVPQSPLRRVRECLVMVLCGGKWGTGLVVSPLGHIITCAHIVRGVQESQIRVVGVGGRTGSVEVVWHAPEGSPWDLALLKASGLGKASPHLDVQGPQEVVQTGTSVNVIGHHVHPALGGLCLRGPLMKVVRVGDDRKPVMLVAATPSFEGASGGVVATDDGRLVGLVTSNLEGMDGMPAVCLAVPLAVVSAVFSGPLQSPDQLCRKSVAESFASFVRSLSDLERDKAVELWGMKHDFSLRSSSQVLLPKPKL